MRFLSCYSVEVLPAPSWLDYVHGDAAPHRKGDLTMIYKIKSAPSICFRMDASQMRAAARLSL
jgi:hypothetical protein